MFANKHQFRAEFIGPRLHSKRFLSVLSRHDCTYLSSFEKTEKLNEFVLSKPIELTNVSTIFLKMDFHVQENCHLESSIFFVSDSQWRIKK